MAYDPNKHTGTKLTDADVTRIETNLDTLNTSIQAIPVVEPKTTVASEAPEIKGLTIDGNTYKIQSLTAEQLAAIQWAIEEKAKAETPIVTIVAPSNVLYNTAITLKWKCTANIDKLEKLELYEGSTKLACNLDNIDNFDDFAQGTEYLITLESSKLITTDTSFRLKVNNGNFQGTKNVDVKYLYYYGNLSASTFTALDVLDTTKFTSLTEWPENGLACTLYDDKYLFWVCPEAYSKYQIGDNADMKEDLENIPGFNIVIAERTYYVYSPNWNIDTQDYTLFNDSDVYKLVK